MGWPVKPLIERLERFGLPYAVGLVKMKPII